MVNFALSRLTDLCRAYCLGWVRISIQMGNNQYSKTSIMQSLPASSSRAECEYWSDGWHGEMGACCHWWAKSRHSAGTVCAVAPWQHRAAKWPGIHHHQMAFKRSQDGLADWLTHPAQPHGLIRGHTNIGWVWGAYMLCLWHWHSHQSEYNKTDASLHIVGGISQLWW